MFRALMKVSSAVNHAAKQTLRQPLIASTLVRQKHEDHQESDDAFDARYEAYFNRPNIDGWEVRKAMNDLQGYDLIPEPRIIIAAMKACRRIDDYALAVRYLEAVKDKCGRRVKEIWPYLHQEIKPTLDELGILTPDDMGYEKPELALKDVYSM
ncbi:cytochrome c oxidase subunit 5A, mitochondrial-like [Gigantopelta aegis]|uniref:cytochrome c oxidase subunit 5A, mitochondrial-like n=1 Tax=Gigantopelta aegis TaxID=1735272 RepID=UPI001B88B5F2|nr:cytochrome c oxidase subunit 5A, mitochondrial-like [Gigantopelta aegis]